MMEQDDNKYVDGVTEQTPPPPTQTDAQKADEAANDVVKVTNQVVSAPTVYGTASYDVQQSVVNEKKATADAAAATALEGDLVQKIRSSDIYKALTVQNKQGSDITIDFIDSQLANLNLQRDSLTDDDMSYEQWLKDTRETLTQAQQNQFSQPAPEPLPTAQSTAQSTTQETDWSSMTDDDLTSNIQQTKASLDAFGGNKIYDQQKFATVQDLEAKGYPNNSQMKQFELSRQGFFYPFLVSDDSSGGSRYFLYNPILKDGGVISYDDLKNYNIDVKNNSDSIGYDKANKNVLIGVYDSIDGARKAIKDLSDLSYRYFSADNERVRRGVDAQGKDNTPPPADNTQGGDVDTPVPTPSDTPANATTQPQSLTDNATGNANVTTEDGTPEKPYTYDENDKYLVGDCVWYNGNLYRVKTLDENGVAIEYEPFGVKDELSKKKNTTPDVGVNADKKQGEEDSSVDFSSNYDSSRAFEEFIMKEGFEEKTDDNGKTVYKMKRIDSPFFVNHSKSDLDEDAYYRRQHEDRLKANKEEYENNLKILQDGETSMSDKLSALEALADNDSIIKQLSDEGYLRKKKARKIVAMMSDAIAAIGNMIAAGNGGTPYKLDSATDKVNKRDAEEQSLLQQRIDYWKKRLEKASVSTSESTAVLRTKMSALSKIYTEGSKALREAYEEQKRSIRAMRTVRDNQEKFNGTFINKWNDEVGKQTQREWMSKEKAKERANRVALNEARISAQKEIAAGGWANSRGNANIAQGYNADGTERY